MINRNNYESFIVDFAEGTLPDQLVVEMEHFLKANPDIIYELELFQETCLEEVMLAYPGKKELKKIPFASTDIHSEYFQQLCIAYIEGYMPESEKFLFLELVNADILKQNELELFQKTVLIPGTISYNEKLFLKKQDQFHEIGDDNFEAYCIAYLEKWLNQEGMQAFDQFVLNHPEKKLILDMYYQTHLIPDNAIVYPSKNQLKHFVFLSIRAKKYLAYASSAAAILVFGAMLFYSSQLNNQLKLTSSLITNQTVTTERGKQDFIPVIETAAINSPEQTVNAEISKGIYNNKASQPDLVSAKQPIQSKVLHPMNPIRVSMLDCPPCKQFFLENKDIRVDQKTTKDIISLQDRSDSEKIVPNKRASINAKLWSITKAGITEISKLTKTEIVVKKEEEKQKTKIAFNSRYFAFSTSVKNKQINY